MGTDTRVAVVAVIVRDTEAAAGVNELLHQYGGYIIGRMGLPYRAKGLSIISVVLDAPNEAISALSGKLGMIPGVSTRTLYSKQGG